MTELINILQTVQRPFKQEIKSGCQDTVVVNGLRNYVQTWLQKAQQVTQNASEEQALRALADLFADYGTLPPQERLKHLNTANERIDALVSGSQPAQAPRQANRSQSKTADLPLFQSLDPPRANAKSHPETPPTVAAEVVPISDVPPALNPAELDFLNTPIEYVKGIGPRRAAKLMVELNVRTVGDMLSYYPRDYLDRGHFRAIYEVGRGSDYETIQGKVVNQTQFTPQRKGAPQVGKFAVYDETGVAQLVAFGRRIHYMKTALKIGTQVVVSGKFARRNNEIQTTDFEFEVLEDEDADLIHTGRIVPKYPLTANLTQRMLRQWMKATLDECLGRYPEFLPLDVRKRHHLIDRRTAVAEVHFPSSEALEQAARRRLAFDEFFLLEVGLELKKQRWETEEKGIAFQVDGQLLNRFIETLPFSLTRAQKRVFEDIKADMASTQAMNRLIQGDVGSGKTVVAGMAMLCAIQSGYQSAMMAPTEILAEQHTYNLSEVLRPLGLKVVLLKGDQSKTERDAALSAIADGSAHVIVGTHALIQEGVAFHKLGLVIIDEQHRFGVMQRATLRDKGLTPDVLVMTATPIPRTLALTVYGDLNVSVIDEMPPGRKPITTRWVKEEDREKLYAQIEKQVQRGRQAYIVYPLVEESEKLEDIRAATEMAEHFQNDVFPHLRVGLLHGRMRSVEKQEVMSQFKDKQIDIMVSTTVIEVGIDVPNATIMVIENAERFGLAQLHQLRGRVGRGEHQSVCYLIASPRTDDGFKRVKTMTQTNDGFKLAEVDLEIRGPGEFFGTRQSGLPDFKIANVIQDVTLLEAAKTEASRLVKAHPRLNHPTHQVLKTLLQDQWKEHLQMASIG